MRFSTSILLNTLTPGMMVLTRSVEATVHKGLHGTNRRLHTTWNGGATATVCLATKMGNQLKTQILDADMKRVTRKSVSPPSRLSSGKDYKIEPDRCLPEHCSHSGSGHRRLGKEENHSSTSGGGAKLHK